MTCDICGGKMVEIGQDSYACPLCNPLPVFEYLGQMIEGVQESLEKIENWVLQALSSNSEKQKDEFLNKIAKELGLIEEVNSDSLH